jgi:hypothetical protein
VVQRSATGAQLPERYVSNRQLLVINQLDDGLLLSEIDS